jgi:NADH:ubiquinone oxidoreductase subunit E
MSDVKPSPLPEEIVRYIEECRTRPRPESYLISVLQRLQGKVGHLSREHLDAVSWGMQIPSATVTGVATFYHFFKFRPRGRHTITVCMGTACYVRGAAKVLERIKEMLHIREGETTRDGAFSIESARCLGACALAPVVVVNERVYGNVKPDDVPRILGDYGFGEKAAPAAEASGTK